jgi:hypothetical protein
MSSTYSRINRPNEESYSGGPTFDDFIPLVIFVTVVMAVMVFIAIFKICLKSEKPIEIDAPPRYDGLDIVVLAPIGPDYLTPPSTILDRVNLPPSYENAVVGEEPPAYTFVNEAFAEDPPGYTEIFIE